MITINELSVFFDQFKALQDISLCVKEDQVIALIGPSGCGKSTLLRTIAGIIPGMMPAKLEGEVEVKGTIDMIFQESSLLPWRKALENVNLGLEIFKQEGTSPLEMLKKVGLEGFSNSLPRELSGGMKQRINLASSLVTSPDILLMDEPFANLDALTRESMWRLIEKLREQQLINLAVLVTHSIEEATALTDIVYVMSPNPGKIIGTIKVDLPRPRFDQGLFVPNFGTVANKIRALLVNGGG